MELNREIDTSLVSAPDDYSPPPSKKQVQFAALAFFMCFDLAGSTAFKTRTEDWADFITYFYGQTISQISDAARYFQVWKYLGDEVAFYAYVTEMPDLVEWVSTAFQSQRAILNTLKIRRPEIDSIMSVKATCWIAPVTGFEIIDEVQNKLPVLPPSPVRYGNLTVRDQVFRDGKGNVDFIGPSIDAGFRLAAFSRPLQLTISAALGYYFLTGAKRTNDLRVVGFESLKGVAHGLLYPAIWYHENWDGVADEFDYISRFKDPLTQRVCLGQHESIKVLEEVKKTFDSDYYFFNASDLEQLVSETTPFAKLLNTRGRH